MVTSHQMYCQHCGRLTPHQHQVDSFATFCTLCGTRRSQLERADTEANVYTAPDGEPGTLVDNTPEKAVFYVAQGEYAGYYVYDKRTGFGAVQNINP